MKKQGILNSSISKILSDMGHKDSICIADCGLPIPSEVTKIDLALSYGVPSFIDVLEVVLDDLEVEEIILAEEIKIENPEYLKKVTELLPNAIVTYISHETFKKEINHSKAVIRTGDNKAYSNIILKSGIYFGELK